MTMLSPLTSAFPAEATGFIDFVNASPTPFHAVHNVSLELQKKGYVELSERAKWKLEKNGKYFVTRGGGSLIAFAIGGQFKAGNGFSIVGTHTDSCTFKIRPISKKDELGYVRIGVEKYGGGMSGLLSFMIRHGLTPNPGLWHTWLDRDLGIAGTVYTASKAVDASKTVYKRHLIHINKPILRIPTVAIHLNRDQNEKMSYNAETELVPILALASSVLNEPKSTGASTTQLEKNAHSPQLLHLLAEHLSLSSVSEIEDFDLRLFDTQPSCLGGANEEFIYSARIDNLMSTYCATSALLRTDDTRLAQDSTGRLIALWDHEEVGSGSAVGAESNFLEAVVARAAAALKEAGDAEEELVHRTIANSFLVSTDVAHAIHPSFPQKHEVNLRPVMNGGPAIKMNANQRYATTAETDFLLKRVAKEAGVPMQEYGVRNDMACGSTIGPLASKIGLRTIDIGTTCLGMHSIRETAGAHDVPHLVKLLQAFHERYEIEDAVKY